MIQWCNACSRGEHETVNNLTRCHQSVNNTRTLTVQTVTWRRIHRKCETGEWKMLIRYSRVGKCGTGICGNHKVAIQEIELISGWLCLPCLHAPAILLVHKTFIGQSPVYVSDLLTGRQHTNTLVATCLQQQQPHSPTDTAAIWRPCVLCRCSPCMESVTDRTETHAVVNNNIQASFKDIPV